MRPWAWGLLLVAGCLAAPSGRSRHDPPVHPPRAAARLERTLHAARARPDDWRAQLEAGAALTREVLEGDASRFDEAVLRLTRAHQLEPEGRTVPRKLGRLLNLPLTEGDLRYVDQQQALYEQLVDGPAPAGASSRERFVDRSFLAATQAAVAYRDGALVTAVVRLRGLERSVEQQLARDDDVDLHAMLGNYAQHVAGMVGVGRGRRTALAIEHLEHVVQRYDQLSPEARGLEYDVPGVHAVFTFWLAELSLAEGMHVRAGELYAAVERDAGEPWATPAMQTLALAARQRRELPEPSRAQLLPPWPHGYDSCIACHAHQAVPDLRRLPAATGALARR